MNSLFGVVLRLRSMLEHVPAGLFTFAALLGAFFHVPIIKPRTFLTALATGFRTGGANEVGEHALPRRDTGGRGAMIAAVQTGSQSVRVLFFPLGKQMPAMGRTGIAGALAVVAGFGALLKGLRVMLEARGRFVPHACSAQSKGRHQAHRRKKSGTHSCTSKEDPKVYRQKRSRRQKHGTFFAIFCCVYGREDQSDEFVREYNTSPDTPFRPQDGHGTAGRD
jgi:hypothetical protein